MRFPPHLRRSAFEQAIQRLRDGRPGESGYGRRVALVLTIPTFDDPVARDVRRAVSGELYVVRTVWNRALDMASQPLLQAAHAVLTRTATVERSVQFERLSLPTFPGPSLRSTRVPVDPHALDELLEKVGSATVQCRLQHTDAPLDATIFEVTFGEELNETRFRWSGAAPPGLESLAQFTRGLIRLADEPAGVPGP